MFKVKIFFVILKNLLLANLAIEIVTKYLLFVAKLVSCLLAYKKKNNDGNRAGIRKNV